MEFTKQGPKRRRYTRRELPEGQVSQYGKAVTYNAKREREDRLLKSIDRDNA